MLELHSTACNELRASPTIKFDQTEELCSFLEQYNRYNKVDNSPTIQTTFLVGRLLIEPRDYSDEEVADLE